MSNAVHKYTKKTLQGRGSWGDVSQEAEYQAQQYFEKLYDKNKMDDSIPITVKQKRARKNRKNRKKKSKQPNQFTPEELTENVGTLDLGTIPITKKNHHTRHHRNKRNKQPNQFGPNELREKLGHKIYVNTIDSKEFIIDFSQNEISIEKEFEGRQNNLFPNNTDTVSKKKFVPNELRENIGGQNLDVRSRKKLTIKSHKRTQKFHGRGSWGDEAQEAVYQAQKYLRKKENLPSQELTDHVGQSRFVEPNPTATLGAVPLTIKRKSIHHHRKKKKKQPNSFGPKELRENVGMYRAQKRKRAKRSSKELALEILKKKRAQHQQQQTKSSLGQHVDSESADHEAETLRDHVGGAMYQYRKRLVVRKNHGRGQTNTTPLTREDPEEPNNAQDQLNHMMAYATNVVKNIPGLKKESSHTTLPSTKKNAEYRQKRQRKYNNTRQNRVGTLDQFGIIDHYTRDIEPRTDQNKDQIADGEFWLVHS